MTDAQKKEFTQRITVATPVSMITILYDIALTYAKEAEDGLNAGDLESYKKALHLFQDALEQLKASLNLAYEPAGALLELYLYMHKEACEAIITKDASHLQQPKRILMALRDAYLELEKNTDLESVMVGAEQVYAGLTYGKGTLIETVDGSGRGFYA